MPDLNLMDEGGGFEESQTPAPAPVKKTGGGGGGVMKIVIIVVALAVVLGGLWFANKKGWVKIPFLSKKQPAVAQIQEEQYPEQTPDQMLDTSNVSLLETTPVEQPHQAAGQKMDSKGASAQKSEPSVMASPKLSEMSGKYTIQVFALHDQKNAEEIVARLADAGYPAYVEQIPMKDGTWYAVRIGKYPSRTEAKKAVETFALELRSSYFIDRVRSN
jgi:hypothetical protein